MVGELLQYLVAVLTAVLRGGLGVDMAMIFSSGVFVLVAILTA